LLFFIHSLAYCFAFLICRSINNALQFGELRPFVNVTAVPRSRIFAEIFKNHVMWSGQNRSVIFTMLGSVQGCHLVEPTTLGQHTCKAITIIPYGEAWRKFQVFMGGFYGHGQMQGPFDYGCLLTLSGRREGYTSPGMFLSMFLVSILILSQENFGISNPVTPKKNSRAFGGSGATASSEWFDAKLQNCIDFDKPSMSFGYHDYTNNVTFFQFLSTTLQEKVSILPETTSLACRPCPCTKDRVRLLTCRSTLLCRFFLLCPPMPRGYQDLLRLQQVALLLMMFCP
jgi:hypothetical protein